MRARVPAMAALFAAALVLVVGPGEARAQDCAEQQARAAEGGESGQPNYKVVERDGRRVFVIEQAFVVCGRVPKPNVIYVLQASSINYQWESLKQDFLPKIEGAVKQEPF